MCEKIFDIRSEFDGIDFGSKRLEERFKKTMEKLSKEPAKSIWLASGNRSEAKAAYRMLSNAKLNDAEILRQTTESTKMRISESGVEIILAVQDMTSVNYDGREKTVGMGYIGDKSLGVNIHSCIAVTPDGLALGLLSQSSQNREVRNDTSASHEEKKHRPIEEKESYRWLETMEKISQSIPPNVKTIHIADREGDIYELYEKASKENRLFVIRIVQNRLTTSGQKKSDSIGTMEVTIPRNSRGAQPKREAVVACDQ